MKDKLLKQIPGIVLTGAAGTMVFLLVQVLAGSPTITSFLGKQIVKQGGYAAGLAPVFGWGVHIAVSFQYAALYGVGVLAIPCKDKKVFLTGSLLMALVLGWLTTLITRPAIGVTISVLAGKGLPERIGPLNTTLGLPFWNHVLFFIVCWIFLGLIPARKSALAEDRA